METLLLHILIGPLMLVITLLFKKYPPKKINQTYGYRTKRSMKNQDTWEVSNVYSLDLMVKVSAITTLCQIPLYYLVSGENGVLVAVCILVIGLVAIYPMTEGKLKAIFDEEGNRR